MMQVFNMGCRMEIYTPAHNAEHLIDIAKRYNVDAQVIGRVEKADKKSLTIHFEGEELQFS
jgi:phosphoribosylformylglycinamidine cyclo-ligase